MSRDVKEAVRDFLRTHVDSSNIPVSWTNSDDIVVANYDVGPDYPEVSVVSDDPVVLGGGTTQFTAIEPTGGSPVQEVYSLVQVDCWGGTVTTEANLTADVHPDETANEIGQEVWNVVNDNAVNISGYDWISASPPTDDSDTSGDGETEYRRIVSVRLGYTQ